jgi:hypothetical protein
LRLARHDVERPHFVQHVDIARCRGTGRRDVAGSQKTDSAKRKRNSANAAYDRRAPDLIAETPHTYADPP